VKPAEGEDISLQLRQFFWPTVTDGGECGCSSALSSTQSTFNLIVQDAARGMRRKCQVAPCGAYRSRKRLHFPTQGCQN